MRPGFFQYRRRLDQRTVVKALALCLSVCLLAGLFIATSQMRPLLESLATTRVSNTVNRIVFEAVNDAIQNGDISYERLISLEKDNDGRITAVHSNMAAFNLLQAQILDIILARIDQVSARELSIPVGTLTGSALLAGRGPRINQTKHQIVLQVDVSVAILLPGYTAATNVSNSITVAETIIVGAVPDTYTYFSTTPEGYTDDARSYILNK